MRVIETKKPQVKLMVGGVIVSHGHLASELITTAEMIAGPMPHVTPAAIDWHDDVDVAHAELSVERPRCASAYRYVRRRAHRRSLDVSQRSCNRGD